MKYVGIDLGTTYSAVSTLDEFGKPIILKNRDGENLTPSVVYIGNNGNILVGAEAKEMLQDGDPNVAMFFKRNMGDPSYRFYANNQEYSATDLSAILLGRLKEDAEKAMQQKVDCAVITVPAYFNDFQRNETMCAAEMAGFKRVKIINEPTSAAITYGMQCSENKTVLVYDLGGGTFDVTVLKVADNEIRVLATGGNHELGGKDWDDALLTYITSQFNNEFGVDPCDSVECYNDLAQGLEKLKKQLSSMMTAHIIIRYSGFRKRYDIRRELFEEITLSLLENTKLKTESVLMESCLSWRDLSGVLLVGGSTKMPMIETWVEQMSGKPVLRGISVDEAVCLGASIYGSIAFRSVFDSILSSKQQSTIGSRINIVDVMSHSLGVVAINSKNTKYVNSIIIPKNKSIPTSQRRPFGFKCKKSGVNSLDVYVTQGELEDISTCIIAGKYVLKGIEYVNNGNTIIDIEYSYDANGIIDISGSQRETSKHLITEKVELPTDLSWVNGDPKDQMEKMSIVLAIDISGSMGGAPLKKAIDAAREFVNNTDFFLAKVALVAFSDEEKVLCDLTNRKHLILTSINNDILKAYDDWGCATDGRPLDLCYTMLHRLDGAKKIIVLTDGDWYNSRSAIECSLQCKQKDIEVFAIGFGDADKEFLEKIATSKEHAMLTNLNNIVQSFGNIAQVLSNSSLSQLGKY